MIARLALLASVFSLIACEHGATVPSNLPLTSDSARLVAPLSAVSANRPNSAKIILVGSGWEAPWNVAVDGEGNVYVTDYRLGEVKKVSPPFTGQTHGKMHVLADFGYPVEGVAVDSKDNAYAYVKEGFDYIQQITPSGVINLVASHIDSAGLAVDAEEDVYAAVDKLYKIAHKSGGGWKSPVQIWPKVSGASDVAIDERGNLYVNDAGTVEELEPSGKVVAVGSGFYANAVAVPLGCKNSCPVYVADESHNVVKKVTPPFTGPTHGKITEIGYGFSSPGSVAVRGDDVFVVDGGHDQVKEVIP
ncbi:MAG: hypothetical protein WB438_09290 [Candidatus Cybelea sp.]